MNKPVVNSGPTFMAIANSDSQKGKTAFLALEKKESATQREELRKVLAERRFYEGKQGGHAWDQASVEAVKAFQRSEGLKDDGLVGVETSRRLLTKGDQSSIGRLLDESANKGTDRYRAGLRKLVGTDLDAPMKQKDADAAKLFSSEGPSSANFRRADRMQTEVDAERKQVEALKTDLQARRNGIPADRERRKASTPSPGPSPAAATVPPATPAAPTTPPAAPQKTTDDKLTELRKDLLLETGGRDSVADLDTFQDLSRIKQETNSGNADIAGAANKRLSELYGNADLWKKMYAEGIVDDFSGMPSEVLPAPPAPVEPKPTPASEEPAAPPEASERDQKIKTYRQQLEERARRVETSDRSPNKGLPTYDAKAAEKYLKHLETYQDLTELSRMALETERYDRQTRSGSIPDVRPTSVAREAKERIDALKGSRMFLKELQRHELEPPK